MKDLDYLLDIREVLMGLVRLRRLWDRRANVPSTSPKIRRLRVDIETKITELKKLVSDL